MNRYQRRDTAATSPITSTNCGCDCRDCHLALHCEFTPCRYIDHMTGPIGLIQSS